MTTPGSEQRVFVSEMTIITTVGVFTVQVVDGLEVALDANTEPPDGVEELLALLWRTMTNVQTSSPQERVTVSAGVVRSLAGAREVRTMPVTSPSQVPLPGQPWPGPKGHD